MLTPTRRWEENDPVHGTRRNTMPVEINLRGLFPEDLSSGVVVPDGLDVGRIVKGLTYGWWDSLNDAHLVVVNYAIPFADPHLKPLQLNDQVVSSRWVRTVR
jgi:hypothetical protein